MPTLCKAESCSTQVNTTQHFRDSVATCKVESLCGEESTHDAERQRESASRFPPMGANPLIPQCGTPELETRRP